MPLALLGRRSHRNRPCSPPRACKSISRQSCYMLAGDCAPRPLHLIENRQVGARAAFAVEVRDGEYPKASSHRITLKLLPCLRSVWMLRSPPSLAAANSTGVRQSASGSLRRGPAFMVSILPAQIKPSNKIVDFLIDKLGTRISIFEMD